MEELVFDSQYIFTVLLIVTRIGGAIMFFPAISEQYVLGRAKLCFALFLAVLLAPLVNNMPTNPLSPAVLFLYIAIEFLVGALMGLTSRIIFLCVNIIGSIMSLQSAMGAAMIFDPNQSEQVSIITNIFVTFIIISIVVTDSHHLLILALLDSYTLFAPAQPIDLGAFSDTITRAVSDSFTLGFKLSAPFLVVSTGTMVGNGLLSRLMANFQVFFVMTPAQILIMFMVLLVTLTPTIERVTTEVHNTIGRFIM